VVLPGNAPIAADKQAIREVWAGMLGPGTAVSWKVTKAEVAKSGELGYLYGTYELTMKDPKGGPPEHDKGKLVEIWKKQADGKWKCIVDTYNSDLAPPSAVSGASK
jgi:Ketosteroid isomerase homolog